MFNTIALVMLAICWYIYIELCRVVSFYRQYYVSQ